MKLIKLLFAGAIFLSVSVSAEVDNLYYELINKGVLSCCRYCEDSKACGDGCINVNYNCHQDPGCACNGSEPTIPKPNKPTTPTAPKPPKRTAGSLDLTSEQVRITGEAICGYINEKWVPIKVLDNGKYIAIKKLINNIKKIAEFKNVETQVKLYNAIKRLRNQHKVAKPICDANEPL